jgi:hypothetical protein
MSSCFVRGIFLASLFISSGAHAELVIGKPVSVSQEIPTWNANVAEILSQKPVPAAGYTECRETTEIPGAFLCVSATQIEMNKALVRASAYIEGLSSGGGKGQIVRFSDSSYVFGLRSIGGHDLRLQDLLRFQKALTEACKQSHNDDDVCMDEYERQIFGKLILPMAKKNPNFVVITYALRSSMGYRKVVTHEILHAQYFNDPTFREVCDRFWSDDLTEGDRLAVKSTLGGFYDATDELLMKNEFQAYILMADAESAQLAGYLSKFREPLIEKLKSQGRAPVQVR